MILRKLNYRLCMMIVLCLSFFILPQQTTAANDLGELLPNGGFEEVEDGEPLHWVKLVPDTNLEIETDEAYVRSGNYSVKLEDLKDAAGQGLRSTAVPITPGEEYAASVDTYNLSGDSFLYLEFWDASGVRIDVRTTRNVTVDQWRKLTVSAFAPEEAVQATVLLYQSVGNVGTTYFDEATLQATQLILDELPNPGFEELEDGFPRYWIELVPGSMIEPETDEAYVYSGNRSVKMVDPSDASGLGLRSSKLKVEPDELYQASVYAYNESGHSLLYLEFWNKSDERIQVRSVMNQTEGEWFKIEASDYSPLDAAYATLLLYHSVGNVGVTYFDDATFHIAPTEPVQEFPLIVEGHPRLYFTEDEIPALLQRANNDDQISFGTTGKKLWDQIEQTARKYLNEDHFVATYYGGHSVTYPLPPVQPEPMPMPPEFGGNYYPYWASMSRLIQTRLETLGLAYTMTGEQAFADKATEYMLSLSEWETWKDPTYLCDRFTCLDTAHLTIGISTAYDMVYNTLTEAEKETIEYALVDKGLRLLHRDTLVKDGQNLHALQTAALGTGGSVLLGTHPDAEMFLTRATDYYEWYFDQRMESGHQEGFSYTSYSMDNMMRAVDHISRTTGVQDYLNHPYLDDFIVRWVNYFLAPGGSGLVNFSDSTPVSYFPVTMRIINNWLDNGLAGWYLAETRATETVFDSFILFHDDPAITPPQLELPTSAVLPEVGWAALRSGWNLADTLLAFKSNNSMLGHNQRDQNSFQIATNRSWIANDPGYRDYTPGPNNDFTVSMGHSTIQVDGQGQSKLGGGHLTEGMFSPSYDYVVGSAADAYVEPNLEKYDRHIVYVKPHYYVMMDDLKADVPRSFDWMMYHGDLLAAEIDGQGDVLGQTTYGNHLYVRNRSAQLAAKFLSPGPLPITLAEYPGAETFGYTTKVSHDEKNTDYRYLTVLKAEPLSGTGLYRAEMLLPPAESSGKEYKTIGAAGTTLLFYRGSEPGDYVTLTVDVPETGDYSFSSLFVKHASYGQIQVYVDGQPMGNVFDSYDPLTLAADPFYHGDIHLTAGKHSFRYEVVGKNEASTSYIIGLSAIQLLPVDADDSEGMEQTTIDAERLQGEGAVGARIQRNDEVEDLVAFKTSEFAYLLDELESDAEQAVVGSYVNGSIERYAMTNGTLLKYAGKTLVQGNGPMKASMVYDPATTTWHGEMIVEETAFISLHAENFDHVHVNERLMTSNEYDFNPETGLLTIELAEGEHSVVITLASEPLNTIDILALVEELERNGEFAEANAVRALTVHLTAVNHFEQQGNTSKVIEHMKRFKLLLDHQRNNNLISQSAYDSLMENTNSLIGHLEIE